MNEFLGRYQLLGWILILLMLLITACTTEDAGEQLNEDASSAEAGPDEPLADIDDAGDLTQQPDAPRPESSQYCELTIEMFCSFYLRCGRMAADDMEACRVRFAEACNGIYEPLYVALVEAGLLTLSPTGIAECESHLASVECERQVNDLDGPCGGIWVGLASVGSACGIGIESFVCSEGSECVVGFDLCGRCEPVVVLGGDCSAGERCTAEGHCADGECLARGFPGDACGESAECRFGLSCVDQICRGHEVVAVGDACDQTHRCPYASVCSVGFCAAQSLLGEPCDGPGWCASGRCNTDGVCEPLLADGEPCNESADCIGACPDGNCAGPPSACVN